MVFLSPILAFEVSSSFPYLSGGTWIEFSDWKLLGADYAGKEEFFNPELVESGDTIYVDQLCLDQFVTDYFPKIQSQIILISANYGYGADNSLPGKYDYLLSDKRIAAWFVQNIDREPTEKLIPIPIGLANRNWPHGNIDILNSIIPKIIQKKNRNNYIYLNITPRPERTSCIKYFQNLGIKFEKPKSFNAYLKDLSKSIFVVSPKGNGIDCHRTWEALLMGCFPIVESSTLNPLYEDLPVLIIQEWDEVTTELLQKTYVKFSSKEWSLEKLYAPFWFEKATKLKTQIKETHHSEF